MQSSLHGFWASFTSALFLAALCSIVNAQTVKNHPSEYYLVPVSKQQLIDFSVGKWKPKKEILATSIFHGRDGITPQDSLPKGTFLRITMVDHTLSSEVFYNLDFKPYPINLEEHTGCKILNSTTGKTWNKEAKVWFDQKKAKYIGSDEIYLVPSGKYNYVMVESEGSFCLYDLTSDYWAYGSGKQRLKKDKNNKYNNLQGSFLLSQPKYRPLDTLRLGGYMVEKNKAFNGFLTAHLIAQVNYRDQVLHQTKIEVVNGVVFMQLVLGDSLPLNTRYRVLLDDQTALWFELEDYELQKTTVSVQTFSTTIGASDSAHIYITAHDANKITKIGTTIKCVANLYNVSDVAEHLVLSSDTIWNLDTVFQNDGWLHLALPSKMIPKVDGSLSLNLTLTTPTNEVFYETQYYTLSRTGKKRLVMDIIDNHLFINLLQDKDTIHNAWVAVRSNVNENQDYDTVQVPYVRKIDARQTDFEARYKDLSANVYNYSNVHLIQKRTKDSVLFSFDNRIHVGVFYTAYLGKKVIASGSKINAEMRWAYPTNGDKSISLEISFLWNGRFNNLIETSTVAEKNIHLSIQQPKTIYPGQEVEIGVQAMDYLGVPLKNVVITAAGVNKNFEALPSYHMPYLGMTRQQMARSKEQLLHPKLRSKGDPINQAWLDASGLSDDDFYKMYNPQKELVRTYLPIVNNSDATGQLAVFVFDKGQPKQVQQIFCNDVLCYDQNADLPNSIPLTSGKQYIHFRSYNRIYYIGMVEIMTNQKLIISLDRAYIDALPLQTKAGCKMKKEDVIKTVNQLTTIQDKSGTLRMIQVGVDAPTYYSFSWYGENHRTVLAYPGEKITLYDQSGNSYSIIKQAQYTYVFTGLEIEIILDQKKYKSLKIKDLTTSYDHLELHYSTAAKELLANFKPPEKALHYSNFMYASKNEPQLTSECFGFLNGEGFLFNHTSEQWSYLPSLSNFQTATGQYSLVQRNVDSYLRSNIFEIKSGGRNYIPVTYDTLKKPWNKLRAEIESISIENIFLKKVAGKQGLVLFIDNEPNIYYVQLGIESVEHNEVIAIKRVENRCVFIPLNTAQEVRWWVASNCQTQDTIKGSYFFNPGADAQPKISIDAHCLNRKYYNPSLSSPHPILYGDLKNGHQLENLNEKRLYASASASDNNDFHALRADSYEDDGVYENYVLGNKSISYGYVGKSKNIKSDKNEDRKVQLDSMVLPTLELNPLASGNRDNFSDLAYFRTGIRTNDQGFASFKVTFPSDITSWESRILAMNNDCFTGSATASLKSYKALMAQLSTPRFLVEGDETQLIAEVVNLSGKDQKVQLSFVSQNKPLFILDTTLSRSYFKRFSITADEYSSTEMAVEFGLRNAENYKDGELRKIPIYPIGLQKHVGVFGSITSNKELSYTPQLKGSSTLVVYSQPLNIAIDHLQKVAEFEYNCNEQMASKVRALVLLKKLEVLAPDDVTIKHVDRDLKKYVKKLKDNQLEDGSWSWWGRGQTNVWMTGYIAKALQASKLEDTKSMVDGASLYLSNQFAFANVDDRLTIFKALLDLHSDFPFGSHLEVLNRAHPSERALLRQQLSLHNLQNVLEGQQHAVSTILSLSTKDILGNRYWGQDSADFGHFYIEQTCKAYRLLKEIGHETELQSIEAFLLQNQLQNYRNGLNTYLTMDVFETILDDLIARREGTQVFSCSVDTGSGLKPLAFNKAFVTNSSQPLRIVGQGNGRCYGTIFQTYFDPKPERSDSVFGIQTQFKNGPLLEGKTNVLQVEVTVLKSADYVKIEVPIPAGCSYVNDRVDYHRESHREYFKNKTVIFIDHLPVGTYTFEIDVMPKYSGSYTVNPSKVELMYFPTLFGNNELKQIGIGK
ncbi:MAG: hypothetical protein ACI8ZN_000500 [Bacteroidia bacterium]|jgi:hypothetical protein